MKPGDRLVCAFVQSLSTGTEFKEWPLHVTVVPWFRLDVSSNDLAAELREVLKGIDPFEVVMGETAKFGRNKSVNLVRSPSIFTEIEERIRKLLKRYDAWLVDETTRRRREYRPHVTAQKSARLRPGEQFRCDRLYIIEQKGEHKTVEDEVRLG